MPRFLSPLPPVPTRAEPPATDAGVPMGRRWGLGSHSALEYLRRDRVPGAEREASQTHPAAVSHNAGRPR